MHDIAFNENLRKITTECQKDIPNYNDEIRSF